ncbi:hypothetical protein PMAYCL1PPCAC_11598 [Pristionchus mayeri]|uniref:Uncharacterized protein n=1 Tax=Pristionchus mayeri TaxID=1317129 RepID=A0AAN5C8C2_9BILA|nr:hypothetical protein PMAYCL1PPCAC_11598 [Pristionchus mayeri]
MKRHCCGCLSITIGAQFIALLLVITPLKLAITSILTGKPAATFPSGAGPTVFIIYLLEFITGSLVFVACQMKKPILMEPIVGFCVFRLFYCTLGLGCGVYGFYDGRSIVPTWMRDQLVHNTTSHIQLEKGTAKSVCLHCLHYSQLHVDRLVFFHLVRLL